jgi:hypothetical protein
MEKFLQPLNNSFFIAHVFQLFVMCLIFSTTKFFTFFFIGNFCINLKKMNKKGKKKKKSIFGGHKKCISFHLIDEKEENENL